jgi:hypothetical protein
MRGTPQCGLAKLMRPDQLTNFAELARSGRYDEQSGPPHERSTNLSAALKIIFARPRSFPVIAAPATLASFAPELLLMGPLPARAWKKVTNFGGSACGS